MIMEQENQTFILTDYAADRTITPVERETVEQQVKKLSPGQQFRLEPLPPIPVEDRGLVAVNCVRNEDGKLMLIALMKIPGKEGMSGYGSFGVGEDTALEVLTRLIESGRAPDFRQNRWSPIQVGQMSREEAQRMRSKEAQGQKLGINKRGKK